MLRRSFVLAGLLALSLPAVGLTMGARANATPVTCQAKGAKTQMPDDLCAVVIARLQEAYPKQTFVAGLGGVVFEVYRASPRAFEARVVTPEGASPRLAALRKDGDLPDATVARLIDQLIAQAPKL